MVYTQEQGKTSYDEEFLTKHLNNEIKNFRMGCFTADSGKIAFYVYPENGGETLLIECTGNELKIDYRLPEGVKISHR